MTSHVGPNWETPEVEIAVWHCCNFSVGGVEIRGWCLMSIDFGGMYYIAFARSILTTLLCTCKSETFLVERACFAWPACLFPVLWFPQQLRNRRQLQIWK